MRLFICFLFIFFLGGCQIQTIEDAPALSPQAQAVKILPPAAVPADCVFTAVIVTDEDTPFAATQDLRTQAAKLQAAVLVLGDYQRVEGGAPLDPFGTTSTTMSGQAYRCGDAAKLPPPPPPDPYEIGG